MVDALQERGGTINFARLADAAELVDDRPTKFCCSMCRFIGDRKLGTTFGNHWYCANCSRQCPFCQCFGPRHPRWWNHYQSSLVCRICYVFAQRRGKDAKVVNGRYYPAVPEGGMGFPPVFRPDLFFDPERNNQRLFDLLDFCELSEQMLHSQNSQLKFDAESSQSPWRSTPLTPNTYAGQYRKRDRETYEDLDNNNN